MKQSTSSSSVIAQLHRLVQTIYALQQRYKQDWISWRAVAKAQEGSEELALSLSSYAYLPESRAFLIADGDRRVKLTEEAVQLASHLVTQPAILSKVDEVARAVKQHASKIKPLTLQILSVTTLAQAGRRHVQAVQVPLDDELIATDTPVYVQRQNGSASIRGRVVGQENDGSLLYIAFENEVSAQDLPARLRVDRAFLHYQLAEAIAKLTSFPERANVLLGEPAKGFQIGREDSTEVADMLAVLKAPWTRFLWGPPGAGKTYAVGRLIANLLRKEPGARILVVAPSNLAADVVLEQFVRQIRGSDLGHLIHDHRILRYGYPRKQELLDQPELLGSPAEANKSKEIQDFSRRIAKAVERRTSSEQEIAVLRAKLLELQEELKRIVTEHVKHCRVVATTTTLAYMVSSPISQVEWDTVLVDEVTMVPPAMCVYLSSLAEKRVLFAGDPRQLGPVYSEGDSNAGNDYKWMGRDVFDLSGVSAGSGEARRIHIEDPRLARITRQRRCAPEIWNNVAHLYDGVACRVNEEDLSAISALPPRVGYSLMIDTSRAPTSAVSVRAGRSWQNPYTAKLTLAVVDAILKAAARDNRELSVAVITPYRAQVKLLRDKIRELSGSGLWQRYRVTPGTIHQFQGSEADIVLFDMVDGPGRTALGALLRGDTGVRLVNVAITRAKGKVILLVNQQWCLDHMEREDNPLLWDVIARHTGPMRIQLAR